MVVSSKFSSGLTGVYNACVEAIEQFQDAVVAEWRQTRDEDLGRAMSELARQIDPFKTSLRYAETLAEVDGSALRQAIAKASSAALDAGTEDEACLASYDSLFDQIDPSQPIWPFEQLTSWVADQRVPDSRPTNGHIEGLLETIDNKLSDLVTVWESSGTPPTSKQLNELHQSLVEYTHRTHQNEGQDSINGLDSFGFPALSGLLRERGNGSSGLVRVIDLRRSWRNPNTARVGNPTLGGDVTEKVSRTNPLESTPEMEAALANRSFVQTTRAAHFMRFLDFEGIDIESLEVGEPEFLSLLGLFNWDMDDFRSPELWPRSASEFNAWMGYRADFFSSEIDKRLRFEKTRLSAVADVLKEAFNVASMPDRAQQIEQLEKEADAIQDRISSSDSESDLDDLCLQRDLLHMHAEALRSGYCARADRFIELYVLRTPNPVFGVDDYEPSELVRPWVERAGTIVQTIFDYPYDLSEVQLSQIYLGSSHLDQMHILSAASGALRREVDSLLQPLLRAVSPSMQRAEIPLIAGTDRSPLAPRRSPSL